MKPHGRTQAGFTLIEMAIVLVIIGLVVGGVLVGADLIRSAGVRATISQIEKYQSAVNTFDQKYGALPGDMPAKIATQYGFASRGTNPGQGDGNGVIETWVAAGPCSSGDASGAGETSMFWVDLSTAGLIDGGFNTATSIGTGSPPLVTGTGLNLYFPQAKLGQGNYIYVHSGGACQQFYSLQYRSDGINYFGISAINEINKYGYEEFSSTTAMTVQQAYNIDMKIDDGMPQSGNVIALFVNGHFGTIWAAGSTHGASGAFTSTCLAPPATGATPYVATNCYDNNGIAGTETYSLAKNANALNCALSFQFQNK